MVVIVSCWSSGDSRQLCRLAAEVERLQPIAEKCSELEVRIEAYEEEIAMIRSAQAAPTEVCIEAQIFSSACVLHPVCIWCLRLDPGTLVSAFRKLLGSWLPSK